MEILAGFYLLGGLLVIIIKSEFLNNRIYIPFKKLFKTTVSSRAMKVEKRVYPGKMVFHKVALNLSKD